MVTASASSSPAARPTLVPIGGPSSTRMASASTPLLVGRRHPGSLGGSPVESAVDSVVTGREPAAEVGGLLGRARRGGVGARAAPGRGGPRAPGAAGATSATSGARGRPGVPTTGAVRRASSTASADRGAGRGDPAAAAGDQPGGQPRVVEDDVHPAGADPRHPGLRRGLARSIRSAGRRAADLGGEPLRPRADAGAERARGPDVDEHRWPGRCRPRRPSPGGRPAGGRRRPGRRAAGSLTSGSPSTR